MGTVNTHKKQNESNSQAQGELCKLSEHSLELLDHMRSIWNLNAQQQQNRLQNKELHQNPSSPSIVNPQEPNLITGQYQVQGATGIQSVP